MSRTGRLNGINHRLCRRIESMAAGELPELSRTILLRLSLATDDSGRAWLSLGQLAGFTTRPERALRDAIARAGALGVSAPTEPTADPLRAWLLTGSTVRILRTLLLTTALPHSAVGQGVAVILAGGAVAPDLGPGASWADVNGRRVAVVDHGRAHQLAAIRSEAVAGHMQGPPPARCAWALYLENTRAEAWPFPLVPPPRAGGDAPMGDA